MKKSQFTGSAWEILVWMLIISVASSLLLFPVAFVIPHFLKWVYEHTTIDDEKLEFVPDGPAWKVLGWMLFAVITFGIGAFYAMKKIRIWELERVRIVGAEKTSTFEGNAWEILGYTFLLSIAVGLFLIPLAWVLAIVLRWNNSRTLLSGRRLQFVREKPWFGVIGWTLFAAITLGLGTFLAMKKMIIFAVEHTHFIEEVVVEQA